MSHLFDTSALIAWWHEIYPPTTFEDVFKLIEEDTKNQFIRAPVEVKQELEEKADDSLTEWVKKQPDLFIPTQPGLQSSIADIANKYPKLVKKQSRVNADPVVIALAQAKGLTVVTQENPNKQNNLVGCCRAYQVSCVSLSQYISGRKNALNIIRKGLWG